MAGSTWMIIFKLLSFDLDIARRLSTVNLPRNFHSFTKENFASSWFVGNWLAVITVGMQRILKREE